MKRIQTINKTIYDVWMWIIANEEKFPLGNSNFNMIKNPILACKLGCLAVGLTEAKLKLESSSSPRAEILQAINQLIILILDNDIKNKGEIIKLCRLCRRGNTDDDYTNYSDHADWVFEAILIGYGLHRKPMMTDDEAENFIKSCGII